MKKSISPASAKRPDEISRSGSKSSLGPSGGTNVRVVLRVRPMNAKEQAMLTETKYDSKGNKIKETCTDFNPNDKSAITVYTPVEKLESGKDIYEKHVYNFDYVFECSTGQKSVYEVAAQPIIEGILEGFNGSILAYGQTSSGKTFTMQGDLDSEEFRGIIPRMVDGIFDRIGMASETMEFTVKAAMIEIYNEKIRDLLDPSKNNLSVHEDKQKGIFVEGLTEKSIGSQKDVYELMKEGNSNRAVGVTNMNAQSSRSHSIFLMTVIMNDLENFSCKTGKLYLVDLAGSEMISKTGATGQTLEEAKNINKSLTMLGRVINCLTDGKSQFIPYRDSKLTRILQESLGGNSKTCLIITASPSMFNAVETLSTCRFGMRAKSIKNNAKVNKQLTVAELKCIVTRLEKEMELKGLRVLQLEQMIVSLGGTIPADDDNFKAIQDKEAASTDESQDSSIEENSDKKPNESEIPKEPIKPFNENSEEKKEEEKKTEEKKEEEKKQEPTIVKMAGDQVDQQKSKQMVSDLEKQKGEQGKNLDALIDQLKQERKRLKIKDGKLILFKQQLTESLVEIERYQRENNALIKNAVDLKIQMQGMEESLSEK